MNDQDERAAELGAPCAGSSDGRHGWWSVYRFAWPWGVIFPRVTRCLFCGEKP